ncbi:hypothetical protein A6X21_11725 [Planctopirus hydrillae]|uniref:Uncharacterized protein n=1 Tax=Planctopirus hydrillae TaxID=1841610 RepID=A0A1C3E594_9PLAN|nr:hypothetical protein A6X21_11725 [Planctopirus hydrillae]
MWIGHGRSVSLVDRNIGTRSFLAQSASSARSALAASVYPKLDPFWPEVVTTNPESLPFTGSVTSVKHVRFCILLSTTGDAWFKPCFLHQKAFRDVIDFESAGVSQCSTGKIVT